VLKHYDRMSSEGLKSIIQRERRTSHCSLYEGNTEIEIGLKIYIVRYRSTYSGRWDDPHP
jgi:hypothetical protein